MSSLNRVALTAVCRSYDGSRLLWNRKHGKPSAEIITLLKNKPAIAEITKNTALHIDYIRRYQAGEPWTDRVLVAVNMGMLSQAVKKFRHIEYLGDCLQEAVLGLLEGCARLDCSRETQPMSFFKYHVKNALRQVIVKSSARSSPHTRQRYSSDERFYVHGDVESYLERRSFCL